MLYSMGPRSLMEIGKKQIIHFCSAILDEEPDPTMLKDLEERTGIRIKRYQIEQIDFLKDVAKITIFFDVKGQTSKREINQ